MKILFDMVAIASGMIGLGGIVFDATPLTPENATLYSTRAIVVLTFVVVPYVMGRAIEKVAQERAALESAKLSANAPAAFVHYENGTI